MTVGKTDADSITAFIDRDQPVQRVLFTLIVGDVVDQAQYLVLMCKKVIAVKGKKTGSLVLIHQLACRAQR